MKISNLTGGAWTNGAVVFPPGVTECVGPVLGYSNGVVQIDASGVSWRDASFLDVDSFAEGAVFGIGLLGALIVFRLLRRVFLGGSAVVE